MYAYNIQCGTWKVESGRWKVESRRRKVEGGKWKVEGGRHKLNAIKLYVQIFFFSHVKKKMSNLSVNEWEVYCLTDSVYRTVWNTTEPTTCPDNNAHTISTNPPPRIIQTIENQRVKIIEEDGITQGTYKFKGYCYNIPAGNVGNVSTFLHTWKYPISLLNGWFISSDDMSGDKIDFTVADNSVIGAIGAPVYAGNTEITVTSTVLENISKGFFVNITDGVALDDLGEVVDINTANSTITVDTAATQTFSPLSPTYVRTTIKVIEDFSIPVTNQRYAFAEKKVGGKFLPKNTPVNVRYTNNSGNAKTLCYNMEYLY